MSEPIDLSVRVLEQIRDELRAQREETRGLREDFRGLRGDFQGLRGDVQANTEQIALQNTRMEIIETTLLDVAGQIVMMSRGLKHAIEARTRDDARLEDHELRLRQLEAQAGGA